MLAYAASRPRIGERRSSPHTMLFIISAHIAAVAAIMSARPDLAKDIIDGPTIVRFIPIPPPPPENAVKPRPAEPTHPTIYTPPPRVPTQTRQTEQTPDNTPTLPTAGDTGQPGRQPPPVDLRPTPVPVSTPAEPMTAASDLRPPYPESKLLAGEEAALTLRLTVDEHGRVVAVDPIGRADPVFLSAARRHLMARWRYKPAMQDGRAVASSIVVTLRFELDD